MIDSITGLDIFSHATVSVRLLFAMGAGFLIGFEREKHLQPAGIRTHMVLSLGACLIMILSLYIPAMFLESNPNADPGRLSAQVISGIGFLGAGAIFRYGFDVKGLTTAASIWTTSGIGLTFGAGCYFLGISSTVLLIVILQLFDIIENRLVGKRKLRVLTVTFCSDELEAQDVITAVKKFNLDIRRISFTDNVEKKTTEVIINCRMKLDFSTRELFNRIKELGSIITLRIE